MIAVEVYDDESGGSKQIHIRPDRIDIVAKNPMSGRNNFALTDVQMGGQWFTLVCTEEWILERIEES